MQMENTKDTNGKHHPPYETMVKGEASLDATLHNKVGDEVYDDISYENEHCHNKS
jgi:hypothetical protein